MDRFYELNVFPGVRHEARAGPVKVIAQMSETFLNRSLQAWLAAHRGQLTWSDPTRTTRFEITRIEASLHGNKARQVRFFGKLKGELFMGGQKIAAALGEWEAVLALAFVQGQLNLEVLMDTLRVAITDPVRLPVPPGWAAGLQTLLANKFGRGVTLPVPLIYADQLAQCGLRATDPLGIWTVSTGDRRQGLLVVAGPPQEGADGPNLLERRTGMNEFSVALSSEAVNAALDQHLTRHLPRTFPVPAEFAGTASEVVLTRCVMRYDGPAFRILEAEVTVKGELPDGELDARLIGRAEVASGRLGRLKLKLSFESIVFWSRAIYDMPADLTELLREQTKAALSTLELDFLLPNKLMVKELARQLELVDVQTGPDELRFLGRLSG